LRIVTSGPLADRGFFRDLQWLLVAAGAATKDSPYSQLTFAE
jgi:hypothetical protein